MTSGNMQARRGPMFDLNGKVAIVTGGNGGIGLGMARGLAGAGARVGVAARNQTKADPAVRRLEKISWPPLPIPRGVGRQAAVEPPLPSTPHPHRRLQNLT